MTSLPQHKCAPQCLLQIVRGYWGAVENGIHWVRDAVLREDACRVRKGALPRVLVALTNVTLTILRLAGVSDLKRTMRSFYRKGARAVKAPARLGARDPRPLGCPGLPEQARVRRLQRSQPTGQPATQ